MADRMREIARLSKAGNDEEENIFMEGRSYG